MNTKKKKSKAKKLTVKDLAKAKGGLGGRTIERNVRAYSRGIKETRMW